MNRKTKDAASRSSSPPSRLRIIGGRWRGVPLSFPSRPELRPTPDRVRETLFNWLQPAILDARCLDLFAGSGVLGFEALSRGAAHAVLVERDQEIVRQLRASASKLQTPHADIVASDALRYLEQTPQSFDIVFLDPPYAANVLPQVCAQLARGWLASAAFVYLEAPADGAPLDIPPGWSMHRSKRAGQVGYHLLRTP